MALTPSDRLLRDITSHLDKFEIVRAIDLLHRNSFLIDVDTLQSLIQSCLGRLTEVVENKWYAETALTALEEMCRNAKLDCTEIRIFAKLLGS